MLRKVVALTLLVLLATTFCNAIIYDEYHDDPSFAEKSEYGMSPARSPTYDYFFDPEVFWGYNRQDNIDNGTAIGANGYYLVTKENLVYFRVDSRDCKQNKFALPKSCVCYTSSAATANNPICDDKPMAHFCQRETPGEYSATYTTSDGVTSEAMQLRDADDAVVPDKIESIHVKFENNETSVTGTNYLGGGLHMLNVKERYVKNINHTFFFTTEAVKGAPPTFKKMYPFNRNFTVNALEIYFPTSNDNCARIDFYGLAYANGLLFENATLSEVYKPAEFKDKKECSTYCKCNDKKN